MTSKFENIEWIRNHYRNALDKARMKLDEVNAVVDADEFSAERLKYQELVKRYESALGLADNVIKFKVDREVEKIEFAEGF